MDFPNFPDYRGVVGASWGGPVRFLAYCRSICIHSAWFRANNRSGSPQNLGNNQQNFENFGNFGDFGPLKPCYTMDFPYFPDHRGVVWASWGGPVRFLAYCRSICIHSAWFRANNRSGSPQNLGNNQQNFEIFEKCCFPYTGLYSGIKSNFQDFDGFSMVFRWFLEFLCVQNIFRYLKST